MKHDFYLNKETRYLDDDEYGNKIDIFRLDEGYHNGPECKRCGESWCQHCEPDRMDEECPSGQLELM